MTARYDYDRHQRIGMPEAILCEGKDADSLQRLVEELAARQEHPVLLTRLSQDQYGGFPATLAQRLDYDPLSRTAMLNGRLPARSGSIGSVGIVTAGTSDLSVAHEARRTLEFMGISATLIADVGVAGLWRLLEHVDALRAFDVLIVVAGMDAALTSVIGGLVGKPIIGVPTSVGYGVATGGSTALNAMLASCAQGVVVTNIDNGFGAACAALRIIGRD